MNTTEERAEISVWVGDAVPIDGICVVSISTWGEMVWEDCIGARGKRRRESDGAGLEARTDLQRVFWASWSLCGPC